jgi:hypothetical protein
MNNNRLIKSLKKNYHDILFFILSITLTLVTFLLLQPKQGQKPKFGFNLQIYKEKDECLHIHHWMYMISILFIIVMSVVLSDGEFNIFILIPLGILIGGSLSDLRYTDFLEIYKKCH